MKHTEQSWTCLGMFTLHGSKRSVQLFDGEYLVWWYWKGVNMKRSRSLISTGKLYHSRLADIRTVNLEIRNSRSPEQEPNPKTWTPDAGCV